MNMHFIQYLIILIYLKMKITKRKLNKDSYELIKNIEIISFIDKNILKKYVDFIMKIIEKKISKILINSANI